MAKTVNLTDSVAERVRQIKVLLLLVGLAVAFVLNAAAEYWDADDLEVMTGTKASTWRYWAHIGWGPSSFRLGKRRVWRRQVVLAWLAAQESAAQDHPKEAVAEEEMVEEEMVEEEATAQAQ